MNRKAYFAVTIAFLLGLAVATYAAKKPGVTPSMWQGASPEDAAAALLERGKDFAGNGSWENIQVGRVLYMSGKKDEAEAIWDEYRSRPKLKADELVRIARAYAHADEWEKAKPLFDQVAQLEPKDTDWLVEIGAFYNLNGDRETAEMYFARGFEQEPRNLRNTLTAAGSYVGVPPRQR